MNHGTRIIGPGRLERRFFALALRTCICDLSVARCQLASGLLTHKRKLATDAFAAHKPRSRKAHNEPDQQQHSFHSSALYLWYGSPALSVAAR